MYPGWYRAFNELYDVDVGKYIYHDDTTIERKLR